MLHTLIEADNYHALQLLAYLYPGMVDCIYIDPPYNSGATDWKYNNNYVDENDGYRHSKWLAMMESRLLLAKKLLNPKDSVLIVTIDEKEYYHLACLLEQIFPETIMQMVSSVINPKGSVKTGLLTRCDEYIFFIYIGKGSANACNDDFLFATPQKKKVRWPSLKRTGSNSRRGIYKSNAFYPIFYRKDTGKFDHIGESLPHGVLRSTVTVPDDLVAVWPLDEKGEERIWQLYPETFTELAQHGFIRFGCLNKGSASPYYVSTGLRKKILSGEIVINGKDDEGSVLLEYASGQKDESPKTVWNKTSHSASEHGTNLLSRIFGDNRFSYPKSLYAVRDTINIITKNKPDAIILDFFAGSGTTLHAVNLLNKEDGGHRRCIMVTNNEVSANEEKTFRARGLHKGDEDWEKYGIARYVNWPRTKCSIEGVDVNGQPINGEYITSNTQEMTQKRAIKQLSFYIPDGRQGINVKKQIVALINDKKMPQNSVTAECPYIVKEDASTAILFDMNSFDDFFDEIHEDIETIYIVSTNNRAFNEAKRLLDELPERTKTVPVTFPMSDGFEANAAFYKLTFLDKEAVSLGSQLDKLLSILWMKAGAHGVCPTHVEGEYAVLPENRMAILIDEYGFDELKEELEQYPEIDTVYIIDDSEENYRALAAQLSVKNTYQLYRDYLDNFKINIERR